MTEDIVERYATDKITLGQAMAERKALEEKLAEQVKPKVLYGQHCIACQADVEAASHSGRYLEPPKPTLFGPLCGPCAAQHKLPPALKLCTYTGRYQRKATPRSRVAKLLGLPNVPQLTEEEQADANATMGARVKAANVKAGWRHRGWDWTKDAKPTGRYNPVPGQPPTYAPKR